MVTFIAFSTLCAQSSVTIQTTYYSGNGATIVSDCRTIFKEITQFKTACKDTNDAVFYVTFNYDASNSTYSFWWPSLAGKGIPKNDRSSWFQLSSSPGSTYTVPSGTWTNGFAQSDSSGHLYVYSSESNWLDSIPISEVKAFSAHFNPGSITTGSSTVCPGGNLMNITEAAAPSGGSSTYTSYQWYRNSVPVSGASTSTYTPAAETATGVYTYTRKVTDAQCGTLTSSGSYILTVVANPSASITVTGAGTATICYSTDGGTLTANLSPITVGSPYTYTWQKWEKEATTWTEVSSGTPSSYVPGNLTDTTAFRVSAIGELGCAAAFSTSSTITVYPQFSSGSFNTNAAGTVCVNGTPAAITNVIQQTAPAGSGSYTYAWYRNEETSTSASTAEYFAPAAETATGAVTYTRKVFDATCNQNEMTSGSYILHVTPTPAESFTTAASTVCYNTSATLSITAPDGATAYAWASSTDGSMWSAAAGTVTSNSFTTDNLTVNTSYQATVTVSNPLCPTVVSAAPATVSVYNQFAPGTITSNTYTICVGGTPEQINNVTAASGGDENYTYLWTYSGGGAPGTITGSTAASCTPPASSFTTPGTYHFQRWAKDGICQSTYTVSANTYTLVVVANPTVSIEKTGPGSATICYSTDGGTLTANLSPITVGSPYTYTWQKWEKEATTWTEVSSGTPSSYVPGNLTDTTAFRVSATGELGCAAVFSTPSTITVYPQFSSGSFNTNAGSTVCVNGTPAAITAGAIETLPSGGSGTYTYEWYRDGNTTPVSANEYVTPAAETVTGAVTYTRKVTDVCDNKMTTGSYILHVGDTPTVNLAAASTTVCYNTPATIATTTPVTNATTYTWESSTDSLTWNAAGTSTSSSFTTGSLTAKTFYRVKVALSTTDCPAVESAAPIAIAVYDTFNAGEFLTATGGTRINMRPAAITGVSAPTGGGSSYTYKWYENGQPIAGATEATYWPPEAAASAVGEVVYTREVTETVCGSTSFTSGSYVLKVGVPPTTNIVPVDTAICNGGSFNLTSSTYSGGTYIWTESTDGVNWDPATGSTSVLTVPNKSVGVYYYNVTITTAAETITAAAPATVTVYEALNGGTFHVQTGAVCADEVPSAIYAGDPTGGSGSYSYRWYKDGTASSNTISGATSKAYQPPVNAAGTYYREVTDASCGASTMTSGSYVLTTTTDSPTTNLNPAVLTVCNGGTITITTDAHATGTYTWSESTNGTTWTPVTGQNNMLNVSGKTGASTYYYKVEIADAGTCGTITSTPSTITVRGAFNAGTITAAGTICVGGTPATIAETSSATGGDGNYSYRWYKEGVLIGGATAATYQPKAEDVLTAGTIRYTREVKDGACATWTFSANTYTLTVTAAAATVTLSTPTVAACLSTGFDIAAGTPVGGTANSYTWQEYVNGAWTPVVGATTQTLTVSGGKSAAGEYYYRAKVNVTITSGGCVTDIYSNAATVTVGAAFNAGSFTVSEGAVCVNMQPQAITAITVPTGGSGSYSYQWYINNTKIDGATAATYQPPVSAATAAGVVVYTRQEADATCNVSATPASGSFTLKVGGTGSPTTNIVPDQTIVCNGSPFTLTAGTMADAQTYTWERSSDGTSWAGFDTNSSSATDAQTAPGSYYYKVTVSTSDAAGCNTVISVPSTITVRETLKAGVFQVTSGAICPGATPAAITGVSDPTGGDGSYTYQWYKNGQPVTGATAATYQPPVSDAAVVGYTRSAKDATCHTTEVFAGSYTLTVTVGATSTINLTPAAQDVCNGSTFTVASGIPSGAQGYTWYSSADGVNWSMVYTGGNILSVTNAPASGVYYYKVEVLTGGTCSPVVISDAATVTVREAFNAGSFTISEGAACVNMRPQAITAIATPVGGSGSYSYQWYKNGVVIGGATAATYQPPVSDAAAAGIVVYTRQEADVTCNVSVTFTSGSFTLKVGGTGSPTTNIVPDQTIVCNGSTFTLTAGTVAGAQTYTWERSSNGTDWTGFGTNSSSVADAQTAPGSYYYKVTVSTSGAAGCNTVISVPSTVTVRAPLRAGEFIVNTGATCVGVLPAAIIGNVTDPSGGDGHYSYQWYKNGQMITGATAAIYQPDAFSSVTTAVYTRGVKDGDGTCSTSYTLASGSYTLTVGTSGSQTTNLTPAAQGICGNNNFDITAVEPADALGYTWEMCKNGTDWNVVSGQNTNVLGIASGLTPGAYYYRVAVLSAGTCAPVISSTPATVTVYGTFSAGTFLTTESATRLNERAEAITGVSAPVGGSGSYSYQWYKDSQLIVNATEATYWPPVSDASAVGNVVYTRQVIDAACGNSAYTSGSYILKVGANPTTNIVPVSTTVCNNTEFTLIAGVYSGTYSWTESTDGVSWAPKSSANNVLTETKSAGVYYYDVKITTATGVIHAAAPATVTVSEAFSAGAFLVTSGSVCAGEVPSTIYAGAPSSGSGNYTYQWYKDGTNDRDKIAGAMSVSYRPAVGGVGTYYRSVTDVTCGGTQFTGGSYVLTESASPTTNLNPAVLAVCAGGAVDIFTDAYNGGIYVWESSDNGSSYAVIGGQSTNILNTTATAGTHYYRLSVYSASACGTLTSVPSTVTVRGAFNAGTITATGTICAGGVPAAVTELTSVAGGDGNYSYRWYKEGVLIGGATAATYQPKAGDALTVGTVTYTREAKDGTCATWTLSANIYTLTVTAATATVTLQTPTVVAVCLNTNFSVAANSPVGGTANSYTWQEYVNGTWENMSGGTTQTLTVSGGKSAAGEYYYRAKVNVTDGGCTTDIYSDAATVTVREAFNPGIFQVTTGAICPGATPAAITGVSAATGGDGNYSYQWHESGSSITGATAATYQPGTFSSATTVVYTRSAKDATCHTAEAFAGSYTLTVGESVTSTINIVPAVQDVCNGATYTVTSGQPAGATSYTWEASADGAAWREVTGSNNVLNISGQSQAGEYYYRVTVQTGSTCSPVVVSTPATVTVREAFNPGVFQVPTGAICPGATPAAIAGVSAATGGDGHYSYQWYKDGQPVSGTSATYQPETFNSAAVVVYTRGAKDGCSASSVTIGSYTLTVSASATSTINLMPAVQSVCTGSAFTVTSGVPDGAQGYTWYSSTDGTTWNPVSGQATKVLTRAETATGNYYYKVSIQTSNTCSSIVVSAPATVTVYGTLNAGSFLTTEGATRLNERAEAITGVSAPVGGSGSYSYQWYKEGQEIPGATGAIYWPPVSDASAVGNVVYTRQVTDAACGNSAYTSGSYILKIGANPTTNIVPVSTTVCNNTAFTLIAGVYSGTYSWTESADGVTWQAIAGSTNAVTVAAKSAAGVYYYDVKITTATGVIHAAAAATVTVSEAFNAGAFLVTSGSVCAGEVPSTIYAGAPSGGSGNYTYQWYKDGTVGGNEIAGATAASYRPAAGGTGTYYRKVTDATCGTSTMTSGSYVLTESMNPTTNLNPAVLSVCAGSAVGISTDAYSGGIYVWETSDDGSNYKVVGGQSTNVLSTTSGTGVHYYKVRVLAASCGMITSAPATVTVYDVFHAGKFTVSHGGVCTGEQPQAITGVTVPTGGSGSYTYQWYKDGQSINATAATYRPLASDAMTVGTVVYTRKAVDVTCATGLVATVGSFTLEVGGAPTTDIIPAQVAVCNNTGVTLTAGAVAGGTYTWESSANGVDWNLESSTTNTLTVGATVNAGDYYYRVTVATTGSANCNKIISVPATVTVGEAFNAGAFQVTSGSVCANEVPSTIYAGAPSGGSGTYTYQWYKDGTADGNKIAGTAASYRPAAGGTGTYYRKVTDASCGASTMTSGNYVLTTTTSNPTINLNPAVLAVCAGGAVGISTDAYSGIYVWESSDNGSNYTVIGGQSTNILSTTATGAAGTHYYKLSVYSASACGTLTSVPSTVTVRGAFNAGTITASGTVCAGGTPAAITATAQASGGDGNYSYRWYKDGQLIAGATAATYQPNPEDVRTAGSAISYTREVKDGTCADWTLSANTYTLTVTAAAATVTLQSSTVTACISSDFSVAVGSPSTGTANSYAWEEYVNGTWTNMSGETAQTLTVSSGKSAAGEYYYRAKVKVTAGDCVTDIYSNAATVTVREAFNPGIFQVTTGAICPDVMPAAITGVSDPTGGDGTYTYQWYESGSSITGATAATYQPGTFSSATTVVYTRGAKDGCTAALVKAGSYTLTVDASATSTINIVPAVQEACNGVAFTVTSSVPDGAQSYIWYSSTDGTTWNSVSGQTTKVLTRAETATGSYYYKVTVQTGSTCSPVVVSTPATVTVREAFNPGVFQVPTGAICPGATPAAITGVSAATGGDGTYTYQWYESGSSITGATAATYQPGIFSSATTVVYTRGAKDGCTAALVKAGSYTLTVDASATSTINLMPAVQSVCAGSAFTVTSGVPDGAQGYTWYGSTDGTTWNRISGETDKAITVSSAAAGVYYYQVIVQTANTCSPVVVSTPATVTVDATFDAGKFLVDKGSACTGMQPQAITGVSKPTGGSGNYRYEWYKNTVLIGGAAAATYQPETFGSATTVVYTRKVIDQCGTLITAGSFTLEVSGATKPTTDIVPVNTTVCNNESVMLTAGVANAKYQWERSRDGLNWTDLNQNTKNLYASGQTAAGDYYYRVTVTTTDAAPCDSITSTPATVTVRAALSAGEFIVPAGATCVDVLPAAISGNVTDPSGGDGNYTYQWYKNDQPIPGATAATYQPETFGSATTVAYTRGVKDESCGASYTLATGSYTLTVGAAGTQTTNLTPAAQGMCSGSFSITAVEPADALGYTWEMSKNGTDWDVVSGQDTNILNIASGLTPGAYYYKVIVLSAGTCAPAITSTPASVTVYAGFTPGTFSGTTFVETCMHDAPLNSVVSDPVEGSGTFTYQWYKNNSPILGATDAVYQFTPNDVAAAGTYTYTREVTDAACSGSQFSAGSYVLVVNKAEGVNLTPSTTTVCYGGSFTIEAALVNNGVTATTYTWERRENSGASWTPLGVASSATLTVSPATASAQYRVRIGIHGNTLCPGISDPQQITVGGLFTPGTITTAAEKVICFSGTPEVITSVADAAGGLGDNTYQWYQNGTSIPGATSATYAPAATVTGKFAYTRKVTNTACGKDEYSEGTYTLRVIAVPVVVVDDVSACVGGTVSLTAAVVGESSGAIYNWQYSSDGANWTNVQNGVPANATYTESGQTLTVSGITAVGDYQYRVQMQTGLVGCTTLVDEARLRIMLVPVGGTVTVGATEPICATSTTTLTLTGNQGTAIAWYEQHNGSGNWTSISGASATQIQVAPATAGTWQYKAEVSNSGCSAASSTIGEVYVKNSGKGGHISLTGDPYFCVGQSRTMNLTGSEGDLQWQRSVDGGAFVDVAGVTGTTYTSETDLAAGKKYKYRVKATISACSSTPVYSDTVELRVSAKSQGGAIVAQSSGASSITMCYGGTATLNLVNYEGGSFRWIYQSVQGSTYTDLSGGNSATYTLSSQLSQGTYNIRVIVDAGCGPDTSSAMRVVVKAPVNVTLSVDGAPAGTTELPDFCKGHELVLKVDGPGASATWTGIITAGTATSTHTGTGNYWRINTATTPGTYTYAVTYADEFCTPSHSGPITVNYLAAPDAGTLTPEAVEFCNGDTSPQTLTLSGTGADAHIVRWEYKSLNTSGSWSTYTAAGSSSMTEVGPSTLSGAHVWRVVVEDNSTGSGACSLTYSNEVQVTRYDVPTINENNTTYTYCGEVSATHTFTGSAGATFKWEKKVDDVPAGEGKGAINETLVWSGNTVTNAPQTITYTVTPVIGTTKECAGIPKTITYILRPPYDITPDEANSITRVSCYDAKEGKFVFTTLYPSTFTLSLNGQPVGQDQMGTGATFTGLGMGTYTLKAKDGICEATKEYVIEGPARPLTIMNESSRNAVCYGGSTGVITFEVDGGRAPYKASINNGAYVDGTTSFSGLAAGVYSVKVQDENGKGCITEKNITVGQNPQLTLTVTAIKPVSAAGAHDATATLQATGGSGSNYRYSATGLDNDFSTRNVIGGLSEGLNYVYAKDGNGCMASVPIQIGAYPADGGTVTISLTAMVTKPLTCDAASDAEITAHAFGSSSYQYSKDGVTFGSSNVLKGFSAGVHTITVKDNANRMATIDVTVSPAVPLTFTATITKPLSGVGTNDAEVTLNIIGNPAAFEYSKNDVWGSTYTFGGLSAQTYAFTVRYKNPASCEATPIILGIPEFAPSTVTPHVGITASITRALVCEDNANAEITVTASGGNGTYSFTSNNGGTWTTSSTATVHVFDGLSAGTYNLQVQSGTDHSSAFMLEVKPAVARPVITKITPTATTCDNSNGSINITATGGVGALEYSLSGIQWSYSSVTTGLSAGKYNVIVKDGRGCTGNPATVTVVATPPVTFVVTSVTPASTPAAADGQIALTIADGQPSYTLHLDGASTYAGQATSTTYTFKDLQAGLYTLTVTDASGCVAIKNVLVGAIDPGTGVERISVTYTTQDPTCHSAANGQITVTARGGSGTYTYSIDDRTYGTSNVFTGLLAGTYVVYVKDNATSAQKVYEPNVVLKGKKALSFTAAVVQSLSDTAVLITAKGGTAPYQYSVNGGTFTYNGDNGYVDRLSAGSYKIVVTDANGCNVSGTIRIVLSAPGESPRPAVSVSIINEPSCFGGNDGTVAVTASGGRAPYAYSVNQVNWTTNNAITGLAAGTYTVYVKELLLDRITEGPKVVLQNPARLTASAVMTAAVTAPGAADGAVRVIAAGGSLPYQYLIDAQSVYQYGDVFTGLQAQLYTFYVKDGKGCVTTTNIALAEAGKITVSPQITKPVSCYGASDAEITITASGGTAPYQYQWNGMSGWNSSATLTGVSAGMHTIFVKDDAGNTASLQMFVPQPMMLAVTAQVTSLPTGSNANGAIAITASGGSGNYTYKVDDIIRPTAAVDGLTVGNYTIEVTDGNGCTAATTTIYLGTVDVVVNKTVINLQKGHVSETYTVRLTSAPQGNVTVEITDLNHLLTITPSTITFTSGNWSDEQEVGVTIAPGIGSPAGGGVTYFTTKVQNRVVNALNDAAYMGINREVIVNISDDGGLNCTDFESVIPDIAINGDFVNSPFAICTSDNNPYVLTTTITGTGITYRWLKDNFLEVSTAASYLLTESGTYTVTVMNASGCKAVSDPFVVSVETVPGVPVITGERTVREGQEATYSVKEAKRNINYKWSIPSGYSLSVGSFDTDSRIIMKIGSTSSILRVLATNPRNSESCASSEGRLNIEVKSSYAVDVFPTVASNGTPLRIIPKNMIINNIAVINAVGESYPYRISSGELALESGAEMQIIVNGLSSGHYFIVFYGREQSEDGKFNGKNVVHTEHIVIKN